MARSNINILRRIVEVQRITTENTAQGKTQEWVYNNLIYPRFFISRSVYYTYLARNAKRELKALKNG